MSLNKPQSLNSLFLKKKKRTLNKRNIKKKENLTAKFLVSLIPRTDNQEPAVEKK